MIARVINLALLTALVIAIPLSHAVLSKKPGRTKGTPPSKVAICHFPAGSNDVGVQLMVTPVVVEVSRNAVRAHVLKHGDCTEFARETDASGRATCRCLLCGEICQLEFASCIDAGGDEDECLQQFQTCVEVCER